MLFLLVKTYIYIGEYMKDKLINYINDNEFKLTIYNNKIHIINFKLLITLEDNYISFLISNKKINITGNNLSLEKLVDKELLIKGNITNIEVVND